MKKLLLAAAIAVGAGATVTALPTQQIEASAKSYDMSAKFAQALKKGTMPRLNGKVGMTYKTLKKKEKKGYIQISDRFNYYSLYDRSQSIDMYGFNAKDTIFPSDKVKMIVREYDYLISSKSVEKYFGKPYKAVENGRIVNSQIYKSKNSKYYVIVSPSPSHNSTSVIVGTKSAILMWTLYDKIYR